MDARIQEAVRALHANQWPVFVECLEDGVNAFSVLPKVDHRPALMLGQAALGGWFSNSVKVVSLLIARGGWDVTQPFPNGILPLQVAFAHYPGLAMPEFLLRQGCPVGGKMEGKSLLAFFLEKSPMREEESYADWFEDEARTHVVKTLLWKGACRDPFVFRGHGHSKTP